ncbi:MAG: ATP-dependent Clp protease adaptor ClpS [Flavobacteriales bacterium]|jgi:ATP-dependent Clp protease adaptor protein ClpS|nr:ATP-dependent Clp protease adaptor ClpS [Flavobacteriales bacterium]MBK6551765.1 ATP-dependent Clp protease adaptor ClpS [Flavobacteriales bacterium]MBK6882290.1 ATP-dependent Clp protease adaptor ClpS [Flavobacteriales bacterium]MBK7101492.1 ATP-dependent Clp protease adaptor ClpS [Flavobacteriales bacterium]MBK7112198.1 ATP-dependent Clp protease adaptor ClpS [Flavobacteriales bacterium]
MSLRAHFSPEELLLEEVLLECGPVREIMLHNDDVNTFDHVIGSLVEVCDHDPIQAEQCAWIVHNNGKCSVKRGTYDQLDARCHALQQRGLSAVIQ